MKKQLTGVVALGALLLTSQQLVANEELITPQIVGGGDATAGEFPWMASLHWSGQHQCGASVINQNWILTAAHCMEGRSASDITVKLGVHKQSDPANVQSISVAEIVNHESYSDNNGLHNDISLLRLATPAEARFTPVALPTSAVMDAAGQPSQPSVVAGWGALRSGGGSPDTLQKVEVPIVSNADCSSAYPGSGKIAADNICAGLAAGGKDSCQGDSGGPLFVTHNSQKYQIGVVSWGEGCAAANKYGVYARVTHFLSWIESKTGDGGGGGEPPVGNVLQNGVAVTGLSGASQSNKAYTFAVPAGATNLKFELSGGTGDADLYVKFNAAPTDSSYDCRPYIGGNNETCSISNIQTGTYHVAIKGYSAYSGVSIKASYTAGDGGGGTNPNELDNNVAKTGISGAANSDTYYTMQVPAGASNLKFNIAGGSGDADIYVRFGAKPTDSNYDCRPYIGGNNENCQINNAQAGTYHIRINGYEAYSDLKLTGSYQQ